MGQVPRYNVYGKKAKKPRDLTLAGRVAVIGAFDTELTGVQYCSNLDEAQSKLGSDNDYDGCRILPILFGKRLQIKGVTGIIGVNITTTETSGGTTTVDKTITTTKLTNALASIKNEKFDILLVAGTLTSTFIPIITTFDKERESNKLPIGYIGAVTGSNITDYRVFSALIDDACYGMLTNQTIKVGDTTYDLLETTAYYTAWVAGSRLDTSLTKKTIPDATGLGTEYTFEDSDLGKQLVVEGFTVFDCYDREEGEYEVVNSEQPNTLDLYINRVRDEIIRAMDLRDFFGAKNRPATLTEVVNELARVKDLYVEKYKFLEDIQYSVVRESSKCIGVVIESLTFADTITEQNIYYTIEVL